MSFLKYYINIYLLLAASLSCFTLNYCGLQWTNHRLLEAETPPSSTRERGQCLRAGARVASQPFYPSDHVGVYLKELPRWVMSEVQTHNKVIQTVKKHNGCCMCLPASLRLQGQTIVHMWMDIGFMQWEDFKCEVTLQGWTVNGW